MSVPAFSVAHVLLSGTGTMPAGVKSCTGPLVEMNSEGPSKNHHVICGTLLSHNMVPGECFKLNVLHVATLLLKAQVAGRTIPRIFRPDRGIRKAG